MTRKQSDNRAYLPRWLAIGFVASLTACAAPSEWRDSVRESIDTTMQESRKSAKPIPAEISQALLPPIEIKLPDGKVTPLEPRFDLTVSNAPARDVFMGLVEGTPYSMVVHPDVRGVVSLNLKEATVPEALEAIRQVYGYEYRRDGGRFLVLGAEMQTRIFTVNYLNVIRRGSSNVSATAGGSIGAATTGTTGTTTGTTGTTTTGTTTGTTTTGTTGTTSVGTESQSDFWKDLTATLTAIIGTAGGRKVVVNAQIGLVVVHAMPNELRIVEDYLGVTHATVNRQVIIDAKIVEVELKNEFQSGINWALLNQNHRGQVFRFQGQAGSASTVTPSFGGLFSLLIQTGDFSVLLDALRTQGEVQVLSSPRVSTVNNQKAVIKVGGDEFFATGVSGGTSVTATGTTTTTSPVPSLSPFFSGIVLDVTPQIDEANNIILHMHPSVSAITQQTKTFKVSGSSTELQLPLSSIQESDNIVRARSGQIIIIGGLMKEASTDEDASVPVLADVPLIGGLFRHKKVSRIKRELVILLKPTSINLGQDWDDAVGETRERMKKIRAGS